MRTLTSGLILAALALGAACSTDSPTGTDSGTVLTLGTPRSVSGAGGNSEKLYTVVVPAGAPALRVTLSGGSGDADLVIRFGEPPVPGNFDCGSFGPSNTEECLVPSPTAGTWHILVLGTAAYSGASLRAEITDAPATTVLTSGVALTNQSGAEASMRFFTITVPAGATNLTVTTTGGTGDMDLYTRFNGMPSLGNYDCESAGGDNDESCVTATPAAGTWHVMLYGWEAYAGVTLTATVTVP